MSSPELKTKNVTGGADPRTLNKAMMRELENPSETQLSERTRLSDLKVTLDQTSSKIVRLNRELCSNLWFTEKMKEIEELNIHENLQSTNEPPPHLEDDLEMFVMSEELINEILGKVIEMKMQEALKFEDENPPENLQMSNKENYTTPQKRKRQKTSDDNQIVA